MILLPIATLTAAALGAAYLSPHLLRPAQKRALQSLCTKQKTIVLTYDDGPSASLTPPLLDLLAAHNAHATFFTLAGPLKQLPAITARIAADGHDLALHGDKHINAWKSLPTSHIADLRRAHAAFPAPPALYRPPFGKLTLPLSLAARNLRLHTCWWTHDSGDTFAQMPTQDSVLDALKHSQGGVLLLHDFDKNRDPERVAYVLELTKRVLDLAEIEKYRVLSLSELKKSSFTL